MPSDGISGLVRRGDRRALARAITQVESTRAADRDRAEALLTELAPHTGRSIRIGVSGAPGVGKSTFIEAFGRQVIAEGHRVAVLAVDPSSQRSRGAILGDKTRMEALARDPAAFVRPSPSGGTLGGVARRTREAMLLCEAAGYDLVIIETVGVGQSETAVAGMVDLFVLLLQPAAGDELQGIKRGIVELADILVVTKSDGALAAAARHAAAEYRHALTLLRGPSESWRPPVLQCSALEGRGIAEVWEAVGRFRAGHDLSARRAEQARAWLWSEIEEGLREAFRADPRLRAQLPALEVEVVAGAVPAPVAARRLLDALRGSDDR